MNLPYLSLRSRGFLLSLIAIFYKQIGLLLIGQLLIDSFSAFLSGVSLYTFYFANDYFFDAVFYTPRHKVSCCFMDGIVHLSFALLMMI